MINIAKLSVKAHCAKSKFWILFFILPLLPTLSFAQKEIPYTLDDRDRMIRIEEKLEAQQTQINDSKKQLEGQINDNKKQLEGQINDIKKQLDRIDNRFNSIDSRLDLFAAVFISSMLVLVGFILWDRRTFLKPFDIRVTDAESNFQKEKTRVENILSALRELAKQDTKVSQVLKQFNLL